MVTLQKKRPFKSSPRHPTKNFRGEIVNSDRRAAHHPKILERDFLLFSRTIQVRIHHDALYAYGAEIGLALNSGCSLHELKLDLIIDEELILK